MPLVTWVLWSTVTTLRWSSVLRKSTAEYWPGVR